MNHSQQLKEARADLAALTADLTTLQERVTNLGHQVSAARQAREFERAADLEKQRAAYTSLLQDHRAEIEQAEGEVQGLEAQLLAIQKHQQLVKLAQEAHKRGEAFKTELHKARDGLVKALLNATDADRALIASQHAFRQGLSELLGNGALSAASATDAQQAELLALLEQVEKESGVSLDAAVQDRRGNTLAFWRRDLDLGDLSPFDALKFGELLRLANEYQEHLELEAGRQPQAPSTPLAPGKGVSLAPVGNQERSEPSTHIYPNSGTES